MILLAPMAIASLASQGLSAGFSFAQGMMGINFIASKYISVVDSNGHTAREEAEGEEVWNSLQKKYFNV